MLCLSSIRIMKEIKPKPACRQDTRKLKSLSSADP